MSIKATIKAVLAPAAPDEKLAAAQAAVEATQTDKAAATQGLEEAEVVRDAAREVFADEDSSKNASAYRRASDRVDRCHTLLQRAIGKEQAAARAAAAAKKERDAYRLAELEQERREGFKSWPTVAAVIDAELALATAQAELEQHMPAARQLDNEIMALRGPGSLGADLEIRVRSFVAVSIKERRLAAGLGHGDARRRQAERKAGWGGK